MKTLKDKILSFLSINNDGVRNYTLHYLEAVILSFSFPPNEPLLVATKKGTTSARESTDITYFDLSMIPTGNNDLDSEQLSKDGEKYIQLLIDTTQKSEISLTNLSIIFQILFNIAKQRLIFWNKIIPTLCAFPHHWPRHFSPSQIQSLTKLIKGILLFLLRMPKCLEYQDDIADALITCEVKLDTIEEYKKFAKRALPKKTREEELFPEKKAKISDIFKDVDESRLLYSTPLGRLSNLQMANAVTGYLSTNNLPQPSQQLPKASFQLISGIIMQMFHGSKENDQAFVHSFITHTESVMKNEVKLESIIKEEEKELTEEEIENFINDFKEKTILISEEKKKEMIMFRWRKMLENEKLFEIENSIDLRNSIVSRFVSFQPLENNIFIPELFSFVLQNSQKRFDLLIQYFYQEYSNQIINNKGDRYEQVLNQFLYILKEKLEGNELLFSKLLTDIPKLTNSCFELIQEFLKDSIKFHISIKGLRDIILEREKSRKLALGLLLDCCFKEDDILRSSSIKIISNDIYNISSLYSIIEQVSFDKFKLVLKNIDLKNEIKIESQESMDIIKSENETNDWNENNTLSNIQLFLTLCIQKPELLEKVFQVYNEINCLPNQYPKKSILLEMKNIIPKLGFGCEYLLNFLKNFYNEELTLMITQTLIETLKIGVQPPSNFLTIIKEICENKNVPKLYVVMIPYLSKDEIKDSLKNIITLPDNLLKVSLDRIIKLSSNTNSLSLSGLLIHLHELEHDKLQNAVNAINICMTYPSICNKNILKPTITTLLEMNPLPNSLMRTMIQSLATSDMEDFILNSLEKLVKKKIWLNPMLYEGFVKCCTSQSLRPKSIEILTNCPVKDIQKAFEIDKTNVILQSMKELLNNKKIKSKELINLLEKI